MTMLHHPIKGKIAIEELEEAEALMILSSLPSIGPSKVKQLLGEFSTPHKVLALSGGHMSAPLAIDPTVWSRWRQWPRGESCWQEDLLLAKQCGVELTLPHSANYPNSLLKIDDPPTLLYTKGELLPCDAQCIAIVGTRQASIYGSEMARFFANKLAAMGFTIVSGLARGIDTSAHLAALQEGRTIAVIGSGLADIYPAENRTLAEEITQSGMLISEFPMATPPDRQNFPRRNRIVSGISIAALLIEAPIKSGAMITMRKAHAHGKKLFAIPGRLDSASFGGNHSLIKRGEAQLVETPEDIAEALSSLFVNQLPFKQKTTIAAPPLDSDEQKLLDSLPTRELSIEEIAAKGQWPMGKLNALLMSLMLKKVIKEFPGRIYKKVL